MGVVGMIDTRMGCLLLLAVSLAAQEVQQAPVAPPTRFERILWTSDLPRIAPLAARFGFTGVQVGRGVDPAPAIESGLGYYLDVGRFEIGVSEARAIWAIRFLDDGWNIK